MKNPLEMQKAMKSQAYGVELEMNHISRKRAARVAASYFGTGRYGNTAQKNMYSTWSAWDTHGREWKFSKDESIVASNFTQTECISPVLTYTDMDLLKGLVRELRRKGAVSAPGQRCGVHIHVNGEGHTPQTLRNLVYLMASHEDLLLKAIHVDKYRIKNFCQPVDRRFLEALIKKKPATMEEFENLWYETQNASDFRTCHINPSRFHMLNLHSFFHGNCTCEFRFYQFDDPSDDGRGGLNDAQLNAYINLTLAINAAAKLQKSARYRKGKRDNESYAMRTWLMSLGFVGEEYKSTIMYLTEHLKASSPTSRHDSR